MNLCRRHWAEWQHCLDLQLRPEPLWSLSHTAGHDKPDRVKWRRQANFETWQRQVRTSQAVVVRACSEGRGCSVTAPVQLPLFEVAA